MKTLQFNEVFGDVDKVVFPCGWTADGETVSQFRKTVIPGEPASLPRTRYGVGRDPESRKIAEYQTILDPGSHPTPRNLAGMRNCDTVCDGRGSISFGTL